MSEPFFNSEWIISRLASEAMGWIGTPFVAHSRVAGAGVDCVNLAAALYLETGAIDDFNPPAYAIDAGTHNVESQIIAWVDDYRDRESKRRFKCIYSRGVDKSLPDLLPGDLLCFCFGRTEHHVGVLITRERFIHARNNRVVELASLTDPIYPRMLSFIWRPVILLKEEAP